VIDALAQYQPQRACSKIAPETALWRLYDDGFEKLGACPLREKVDLATRSASAAESFAITSVKRTLF
jgi:hypothetical protein